MTRYHPVIVVLHWLLALMILMALVVGGPMLKGLDNANPDKIGALAGHMTFGLAIGAFMVIRLITRLTTQGPPHADTGNALLNLAGRAAHALIYVLVLAMVASGIGIAFSADLFAIVFAGSGASLPESFQVFPPRAAHGVISKLLLALIVLHVLAWIYHQWILKDGLISRMWFGKRG